MAKPARLGISNSLIIHRPDSITVCSDPHVFIQRDFVRVCTPKRVFEIDLTAGTSRDFPNPDTEAIRRRYGHSR